MILAMATLSDAHIARLLADPPLVWRVTAPDDPEAYEEARRSAGNPSFLKRLFLKKLFGKPRTGDARSAGSPGVAFVLADGEGLSTDLDKAWHGIHYLLTGTAWEGSKPLNLLVVGGRGVGDIDVGYGPARVLFASETRAAQQTLSKITDDELRARFDAVDMMKKEIYPEIWDRPPDEDDTLGYLLEYVRILRAYLAQTVEQGHGLLVYLT